ncbi:acetyl-coa hydrolase/transferase [hydrocarbon metagenome]|uniref:Acetyl-coa hydrolase/transferase n=1 Tax=hydrocarbon metagenome TaxID=938273 RepID=A0A0W8E8L9_9ZZZZ
MSILNWKDQYNSKKTSYEEAAKCVKSGDFITTPLAVGACSGQMLDAIIDRHEELKDVIISDSLQIYPSKLYDPKLMAELDGRITYAPVFGIVTIRKMHATKVADYYQATTGDCADRYGERSNVIALMVSAPNAHGYVNLGPVCFYTADSIRYGRARGNLRTVIAEVNDQMPIVYGDNWMHVSEFDMIIERSQPIPTFKRGDATEVEKAIGDYVLELINDGDTIQMGLGGITEAVAAGLEGKKNLGILTEMLPQVLPQLIEKGIVDNSRKPLYKGISVASFCLGNQELYDFINENPSCQIFPGSYTNDPRFIAQHPNVVAMNTSLMIDFSGQSTAEAIGHTQISGVGGQLEFITGAYWSDGGKPINMLSAARTNPDGSLTSAIVPELPPGTPVSVPRMFTDYVITEYGVARLRYKSRRERALELISIAHPDLRAELKDSLKTRFYPGGK